MEQDIYKTVTVEQFKEMFFRDFPFLPLYEEGKTYWKDDVVYYTDENFYKSLIDDNTQPPTDTEAWTKIKGEKIIKAQIADTLDELEADYLIVSSYADKNTFENSAHGGGQKRLKILHVTQIAEEFYGENSESNPHR